MTPSLEYLLTASPAMLQMYMLSKLDRAAQLRKIIRELEDEAAREEVAAELAEFIARHAPELRLRMNVLQMPLNFRGDERGVGAVELEGHAKRRARPASAAD